MSDNQVCTEVSDLCPVDASLYGYRPNLGVNAAIGIGHAIFGLALIGSICCFRVRTWSFTITLLIGVVVEIVGYIGRVMMNDNPFSTIGVSAQLIALIVAPSFIAAAMSVTFKHIIVYCGAKYSWIRPRLIPWVMIGTDFLGIVIQFLGSAVLASEVTGDNPDQSRVDLGNNIIIFGVVFQAFIMVVSAAYMLWFGWRMRKDRARNAGKTVDGMELLPKGSGSYELDRGTNGAITKKFKIFCRALSTAYTFVLLRCIYRCVEMISGWGSSIMREEVAFLVLDGLMVLLAVATLTIFQPGFWFAPMMRKTKQKQQWSSMHAEPYRPVSALNAQAGAPMAAPPAQAPMYDPMPAQPYAYQPPRHSPVPSNPYVYQPAR